MSEILNVSIKLKGDLDTFQTIATFCTTDTTIAELVDSVKGFSSEWEEIVVKPSKRAGKTLSGIIIDEV